MKQAGNALFLILIAVALFAVLSYAVTQSGRGGGSIDKESASITAAQITQYTTLVQQTLQRMLINGCSDTEVSFLYDSDGDGSVETNGDDDYYNPNTPGDNCLIFDNNGGGITLLPPPSGSTTTGTELYRFIGASEYKDHGTNADDLAVILRNVSQEVCLAINRGVGIPLVAGDAPSDNSNSSSSLFFEGTYGGSARIIGDQAAELIDEIAGCHFNFSTNWYEYFHVLIPR